MSSKGKNTTREAEIEKCREEGNWKKVIELSEDMKKRLPPSEPLANFLIAEARLERYLDEHVPSLAGQSLARVELAPVRVLLRNVISSESNQKEMGIDAHLLMAKLQLAMGNYHEALNNLTHAGLDSLARRHLPSRSLRIVAESFAVKGICLEQVPAETSSKFRASERRHAIIAALELASDLALLYLQELERCGGGGAGSSSGGAQSTWSVQTAGSSSSPLPPPSVSVGGNKLSYLLETALQRAPFLMLYDDQLPRAVQRYRTILSAAETPYTQSVRLHAARQLAAILMFCISACSYPKLQSLARDENSDDGSKSLSRVSSSRAAASPWKPRRHAGSNVFSPKQLDEEVILLLLISESLAVREAVLSQSPETSVARSASFNLAVSVYDLMTLSLIRHGQAVVVCESLERALRFSFESEHVWRQLSLCLAAAGRGRHSLLVSDEAVRLNQHDPSLCLLAARNCYQHLHMYADGLSWSERALTICEQQRQEQSATVAAGDNGAVWPVVSNAVHSRCLLHVGIGKMLASLTTQQQQLQDRRTLATAALDLFNRSHEMDAGDHLAAFYVSLQLASGRQLLTAVNSCRLSLELRPDHLPAAHLLVLLLTAQKRHSAALQLLEAVIDDFPDSFQLMYLRVHLEEYCSGTETALSAARSMLQHWRHLYDSRQSSSGSVVGTPLADGHTDLAAAAGSTAGSTPDTGSLYGGQSTVACSVVGGGGCGGTAGVFGGDGVGTALSEVDSSLRLRHQLQPPPAVAATSSQQLWHVQLQLWLLIAELYLKLDQVEEAVSCVQEAVIVSPTSHLVMHAKGLVHEHRGEHSEACRHYTDALALCPHHSASLQRLGLVHHYLGNHRLAEKVLRDALHCDPLLHQAWYNLGMVLDSLGEFEAAADCFTTCVDIESTAPILPFTSVAVCFE